MWTHRASRTNGLAVVLGAVVAGVIALGPAVGGEELCTRDAMIVFDGSGSMSEMGFNDLDEPRIYEARRAVRRSIPHVARYRRIGLIVYGPGSNGSCGNIDLRFGPVWNAAPRIIGEVDTVAPEGETPLTASVEQAARVLDYTRKAGVVVLVTDGKETCGGSPCQLAARLAAEAEDLTVHVIGFKVRSDYFSWQSQGASKAETVAKCLAERTGGKHYSTETADELATALEDALGCPLIGRVSDGGGMSFAGPVTQ